MLLTSQSPGAASEIAAVIRQSLALVGSIDSVNTIFTLPFGEVAVHTAPGPAVQVMYNGQVLQYGAGDDYSVSESGGLGTGFDTVTMNFAPLTGDRLTVNYVLKV